MQLKLTIPQDSTCNTRTCVMLPFPVTTTLHRADLFANFMLLFVQVKPDVSRSSINIQRRRTYLNITIQYLNAIWNVINFEEASKRYDVSRR